MNLLEQLKTAASVWNGWRGVVVEVPFLKDNVYRSGRFERPDRCNRLLLNFYKWGLLNEKMQQLCGK